MRRHTINVRGDDVWFDDIACRIVRGHGMVDGTENLPQVVRLAAAAKPGNRLHEPDRRVRVLTAILADSRNVALDVAGLKRALVEGRLEQFHQPIVTINQVTYGCFHGAN